MIIESKSINLSKKVYSNNKKRINLVLDQKNVIGNISPVLEEYKRINNIISKSIINATHVYSSGKIYAGSNISVGCFALHHINDVDIINSLSMEVIDLDSIFIHIHPVSIECNPLTFVYVETPINLNITIDCAPSVNFMIPTLDSNYGKIYVE
jgi:hypothetical protein